MDYKIVSIEESVQMFELKIKEMLRDGWRLQGGVSVFRNEFMNRTVYSQAMSKGL